MVVVTSPITPLLTPREVAEILRVSRAQAYLLKDRIGYVQIGRHIRFEPEAVFAYVQQQRRCHVPALVSSGVPTHHSGTRYGLMPRAGSTASPRVAEIMERQRRGLRRAN